MLDVICIVNKPGISDCFRLGTVKQGASRPVKILFRSNEAADTALRYSSGLKETPYSKVFLTPDQTPEERTERRNLVKEMKEKIGSEPPITSSRM